MSFFNSLLAKTSSLASLCCLFVSSHVIFLLMMAFTFPRINAQIGTKAFDLQPFGYSVAEARSIVAHLDTQTNELYLFPQLTILDLLYPVLLALFLSSFLFRLFSLTQTKQGANTVLLIVPFLAMGFDYLENICVILMITKSVEISESFVLLSSTFTILKGTLTSIAWMGILGYSIKWVRMKFMERKNIQPQSPSNL